MMLYWVISCYISVDSDDDGDTTSFLLQANSSGSCYIPLWPWSTLLSLVRGTCHCAQTTVWIHVGRYHQSFPAKRMLKSLCAMEPLMDVSLPHHVRLSLITCGQPCTCYYPHVMLYCHKFCSALLDDEHNASDSVTSCNVFPIHETCCRQTSSDICAGQVSLTASYCCLCI